MAEYFKPSTAMIFAAGFGKRMLPLTEHTPKPLIKVKGKPLLEYNLDLLQDWGIKKAVVNTHHLPEQINDYLDSYSGNIEIIKIHEPVILETGGGVANALHLLGNEPFLTVNSDVILVDNQHDMISKICQNWKPDIMDALMVLHDKNKAFGYDGAGDFNINEDSLIVKNTDKNHKYVFTGIMLIKPQLFDGVKVEPFSIYKDFIMKNYMDDKGIHNKIHGIINMGEWFHVGNPENIRIAEGANRLA